MITKIPRKWCLPVKNTQWKFCLLSGQVGRTVVRPSSCCVKSCNEGTGILRNLSQQSRVTSKRHHNTIRSRRQNATQSNATQPVEVTSSSTKNSTQKLVKKCCTFGQLISASPLSTSKSVSCKIYVYIVKSKIIIIIIIIVIIIITVFSKKTLVSQVLFLFELV